MSDPYGFGDAGAGLPPYYGVQAAQAFSYPDPAGVDAAMLAAAEGHHLRFLAGHWEPEAELAHLLRMQGGGQQEDTAAAAADTVPLATEEAAEAGRSGGHRAGQPWPGPGGAHHHRAARRRPAVSLPRTVSFLIAAVAAVVVAMVSVFGGIVAYDPLREVSTAGAPVAPHAWWPFLVFGPWAVASLSILRAALHRRRAVHSWAVALLFSAVAVGLCVVQAPRTGVGWCTAALPPVAALASFQQLVRQITLTRPPRSLRRHRCSAFAAAGLTSAAADLAEPALPGSGSRRRPKAGVPQQQRPARPV